MKKQLAQPDLRIYESALMRTVTSLIIGQDYLLLVDPNWLPQEVDFIYTEVHPLLAGRYPYLLFTHSDYDHIIGYEKFLPDFTTIASRPFVDNSAAADQVKQIREFDDAYYLSRPYPISYPKIDTVIDDEGQQLRLGHDRYRFYHAPGHNADGLLTFNVDRGILIVGDYLSNVEFPFVYHSVAAYRLTLAKLAQLIDGDGVKLLITGHGDHTTDRTEMQRRIQDSYAYLDALEGAVATGVPFDTTTLFARYGFPTVMQKFHDGNLETLRRER